MKTMMSNKVLRNSVLLLLLSVPFCASAQQKKESTPKPPTAPSHAAAPAQHSAPPAHNAPTGHAATPNSMSHAGPATAGHTNNTAAPGHSANAPGHSANAPGHAGNPSTNGMGHGATNPGHAAAAPGHATTNRTPPGRQVSLRGGGSASIRPNGQIRSVNRNGMQIQHGLHGGRTIVSTHNGARVVTTGAHGGYVQRNYVVRNGNTYVSRTYVENNVTYTGVYRSYGYAGYCCYYGYAPAYYYTPVYYGWAYNPWPAPAYYGWGWAGQPWYGYYGPYYAPYPVYPSAAFWLTDYLIAASLQAAYSAQVATSTPLIRLDRDLPVVASLGLVPAPGDANVTLTKEVKDQLAEEVKAQLAEDQSAAGKSANSSGGQSAGGQANGPPPALDPKRRLFVVNDEVSTMAGEQECSLTSGDIISRVSDTPDEDRNVDVKVLASKKGNCAVGAQVSVAVDDLQEMHNHFREQLSGGMGELSKKQGTGGLPKAPDTSKVDGEVPAPPPDNSAAKTLKDQQAAADQTEAEVKQEAGSSGGGAQ